jgi:uncharacterized protein
MSPDANDSWPVLSFYERRMLGVLVEKQKTTDTYPLTLNSLVTGCNQKSNRDPLLELDDGQVEEIMGDLQEKGLVNRLIGGRVDKWKHNLYDVWKVSSVELAILAELLLRGPQTEGELRARASRMDDIADLETLRQLLVPLKERKLVVYLTPENRRGSMLTHGFHDPAELPRLAANLPAHAHDEIPAAPGDDRQMSDVRAEIAQLRQQLAALEATVQQIRQELGIAAR